MSTIERKPPRQRISRKALSKLIKSHSISSLELELALSRLNKNA